MKMIICNKRSRAWVAIWFAVLIPITLQFHKKWKGYAWNINPVKLKLKSSQSLMSHFFQLHCLSHCPKIAVSKNLHKILSIFVLLRLLRLGVIYSPMSALDHTGLGGIWLKSDWFLSEQEKPRFFLVFILQIIAQWGRHCCYININVHISIFSP